MQAVPGLINSDVCRAHTNRIPSQVLYHLLRATVLGSCEINSGVYTCSFLSPGGHHLTDRIRYQSSERCTEKLEGLDMGLKGLTQYIHEFSKVWVNELTKPSGWKVKMYQEWGKRSPVALIQTFNRYRDLSGRESTLSQITTKPWDLVSHYTLRGLFSVLIRWYWRWCYLRSQI